MTAELVRQATHTVKVAGTIRDADSISIERSIATSMPAQVAGGGGIPKASGMVALGEPDELVTVERDSPWFRIDGWPPARNSAVTVDTAMNDADATRRFTGRVAAVKSSTRDRVALDVEDYTDRLKVTISQQALLRTMPPPGDNTGDFLYVSLRADYLANRIFRKAGYTTTPPVAGIGCLSVPAQGSMWPEVGTCQACTEADGTAALPSWYPAPWGWAVADVAARYSPPAIGNSTMRGRTLAMGMMCAPDHAGTARMDAVLGELGPSLTVTVLATRQVQLRVRGSVVGTVTPPAGWTRLDVTWGEVHGGARVRTNDGFNQIVSATLGDTLLTAAYTRTEIQVQPNARVAGFMVQFAPNSYTGGYAVTGLTATIVPGSLLGHMRAMPSITSRDGLDLLGEISKALVISMWIDRNGHLWWVHPDVLRSQAPVAELTSTKDLLDLAWEDTSDSARRLVTLTYDDPTIRRKAQYRLTAWEGSGDNLKQGESYEEIIDPGASTDWIEVDDIGGGDAIYATPYPSNKQSLPDFNRGIGSWVGGTHLNSDGDSPQTLIEDDPDNAYTWAGKQNFPNLQRSLTRIGPAAWKLNVGLQDIDDNTWIELQQALDPVQTRTIPNLADPVGSRINKSWTSQKLPIIRCKAITDWESQEYTSSITGPEQYDDLDHNVGPWAGESVPAFGDWLARQVTDPAPILQDLPVVWRDDVQVGQVITVTEDIVYNVRLTCLVIGLREDHTRGSSTMRLTCRVITVQRLTWTYDEQSRYWEIKGGDYDTQSETGKTYIQDATPPADLAEVLATPLVEPLPAPLPPEWPDEEGS